VQPPFLFGYAFQRRLKENMDSDHFFRATGTKDHSERLTALLEKSELCFKGV
jgi:hypothetical protein